jgi:putative aminopeptidase FrvX
MRKMAEKTPVIGPAQIRLLERLCNACAVSGDEGEVRQIVLKEIESHADEVKVDALGNVLAVKKGSGRNRLRVMLDAHMDEVGFMIVADDGDGIYRFDTVGGLDVRQLVGKQVLVGKNKIPGVIGARAIHLTTEEERKKKIPLDQLRIDVGLGGAKVKPGDRATFASKFKRVGPSILSKAIDDRIGVATLIELIKSAPGNVDLCASFSVQEEIGLRGAKVAAHHFNPHLAIALDATPANDLPSFDGSENVTYNTRLGLGPAIYTTDAGTLSDPRLIRFLAQTAEAEGLLYQFRQPGSGGTDAGAIHKQLAGIPAVSVSVPHRYTHTACSISRMDDWRNTLALISAALRRMSPRLLSVDRP